MSDSLDTLELRLGDCGVFLYLNRGDELIAYIPFHDLTDEEIACLIDC